MRSIVSKTVFAVVLAAVFARTCAAGDSDKVPLQLELPKPLFVGTPKTLKTPNLEEPRKGPRPEFLVHKGATNVALNKPVSSSDTDPNLGKLTQITDGEKAGVDGCYVELNTGLQWVQIDLGAPHVIDAVVVWHYHGEARIYKNVVVQIADDADFVTGVKTIFNNDHDNSAGLGIGTDKDYVETNEGKLMDAKGNTGRYVRLYSQGSTSSDQNHYIEVEVYGVKK